MNAYILTSKDFSEKNIKLLKSLSEIFNNFEIIIINMEDNYENVRINVKYISTTTLYRLLIPYIVDQLNKQVSVNDKIEKCIYIDSDVVIESDISTLFNIDIEGYCLGGVIDLNLSNDTLTSFKANLGIPSLRSYINAGVLLLNLKEINKNEINKKLIEAGYRNDFQFNDQDAINSVCYGRIKILPLKYNVMSPQIYRSDQDFYEKYGFFDVLEARRNPIVVHYILKRKPWIYRNTSMAERWWKYIKMQDEEVKREYIKPFLKEHKVSMVARMKESMKSVSINFGIYNFYKKCKKMYINRKENQ